MTRTLLRDIISANGYQQFAQPIHLSSGVTSRDFIDTKVALSGGDNLAVACQEMLWANGVFDLDATTDKFDAVGGMTMGADHLAHGMALIGGFRWFSIRQAPKGRGTNQLIEGADLAPGDRVLLIDDVVTTGASIRRAYQHLIGRNVVIVGATCLVDRGDDTTQFFSTVQVPYVALLTYEDFNIDPVITG